MKTRNIGFLSVLAVALFTLAACNTSSQLSLNENNFGEPLALQKGESIGDVRTGYGSALGSIDNFGQVNLAGSSNPATSRDDFGEVSIGR
jgi:hypothetical protein